MADNRLAMRDGGCLASTNCLWIPDYQPTRWARLVTNEDFFSLVYLLGIFSASVVTPFYGIAMIVLFVLRKTKQ